MNKTIKLPWSAKEQKHMKSAQRDARRQNETLDIDVLMHKAEVLADKYQYLLPSDNDSIRLAKEIKALIKEAANV